MKNRRILNFDRFMKEKERETIDIVIMGKTYTINGEIPAIVPVMMARAQESNDPQASVRMVFAAADALLGTDTVTELCAAGISAADLTELVQQIFAMINGADDDDDEQEVDDEDGKSVRRAETKNA